MSFILVILVFGIRYIGIVLERFVRRDHRNFCVGGIGGIGDVFSSLTTGIFILFVVISGGLNVESVFVA